MLSCVRLLNSSPGAPHCELPAKQRRPRAAQGREGCWAQPAAGPPPPWEGCWGCAGAQRHPDTASPSLGVCLFPLLLASMPQGAPAPCCTHIEMLHQFTSPILPVPGVGGPRSIDARGVIRWRRLLPCSPQPDPQQHAGCRGLPLSCCPLDVGIRAEPPNSPAPAPPVSPKHCRGSQSCAQRAVGAHPAAGAVSVHGVRCSARGCAGPHTCQGQQQREA